VLPPPITATSLSLKNGPSHVAQNEIPLPKNFSYSGSPKVFGIKPVATITDLDLIMAAEYSSVSSWIPSPCDVYPINLS
jgi:hypothetical protein